MARLTLTNPHAAALLVSSSLALAASGCFQPDEPGDDEVGEGTDETADGSTDDTTGDTTDDTTTDDDTTTTEGAPNEAPTIDSFTLNGEAGDILITAAGAVQIAVEASDSDGEIAEVQILRDGEEFAVIPGPGPFTAEFVVGGEAFDGNYVFDAVAVDDGGLDAYAGPLTASVDVPLGGEIEAWDNDWGANEFSYRIAVDPDGTQVLVSGYESVMSEFYGRIERFQGEPWATDQVALVQMAAGLAILDDARVMVSGWSAPDGEESVLLEYDSSGAQLNLTQGDWTSPGTPPANFEAPLDLITDADGNLYVAGVFTGNGGSQPDTSYMFKFNAAGDLLWQFHSDLSDAIGQPVYGVNIDVRGEDLLLTGQARTPVMDDVINQMWFARFDTDGNFQSEVVVDGDEGFAWAGSADPGGQVLMGGMRFTTDVNESYLARYGANGQPLWTKQGGHEGIGAVVGTAIDPFGNYVALMLEECVTGFFSLGSCSAYVRKYTPGGDLIWEQAYATNDFAGPSIIPLAGDLDVDRFGYIYATIPRMGEDMDYWAVKLHP